MSQNYVLYSIPSHFPTPATNSSPYLNGGKTEPFLCSKSNPCPNRFLKMDNILATLVWPEIRDLDPTNLTGPDQCGRNSSLKIQIPAAVAVGVILRVFRLQKREEKEFWPTLAQLVKNPLALVPKDTALFAAGAIAGAAVKTVTTSLDRIKLLMKISRETENQCLGE
ncbi:uncharacterized protein LOC111385838 isoform X2 [Olea europaea var. sylvestris]|uniref:uncharacterized protein LOC111385838 isoform X2 n=1 Tax=Olea europaea var. sylvestris TaxID=158386 RepID=UPI000C1D83EB|nr:uncharacterized protein LOC111385838 isoform X2 [Olea europaea var. sylvestris]